MSFGDSPTPDPKNPNPSPNLPPALQAPPYHPNPYESTVGPSEPDEIIDAVPVKKIGVPIVAWLVIIAIVTYIVVMPRLAKEETAKKETTGQDVVGLKLMEVQGKYFVGALNFLPMDEEQADSIFESTSELNKGTLDQRYRYIVLAGELGGADQALQQLTTLNYLVDSKSPKMTSEQQGVGKALKVLYNDYEQKKWDAPSLTDSQRKLLQSELGWFGDLALAPESGSNQSQRDNVMQSAKKTFFGVFGLVVGMLMLGCCGLIGAFVFAIFAGQGKIRSNIKAGKPHGGVYAETFAIWMLLFVGLSILAAIFATEQNHLAVSLVAFFTSLLALAWPVIRGIRWREVREDVGLTLGKHVLEPFWGFVCYACTIPLLIAGVVMMFILMTTYNLVFAGGAGGPVDHFAPTSNPSHPIVEWIAEADIFTTMVIVMLACVAAPIVEETMFRGVLYRHLRDATATRRVLTSVIFSGLLSSFIFAVIHPQGFFAVPPLMGLALGFSLAREWRGSLIAPMTMHALNNGMVTALMLMIL